MNIKVQSTLCALALFLTACDDSEDTPESNGSEDAGNMMSGDGGGPDGDGDASTDPPGPEPRGPQGKPALGKQIDRMGRPAINTALNAAFQPDANLQGKAKDAYNAAGQAEWKSYVSEMAKNLAILDALNGNCGDQLGAAAEVTPDRYKFLAGVLADDQLYVNSERKAENGARSCGVYLGVEAEAVSVLPAGMGGCGGRTPNDDVIDRSYSVLAAGLLTGVDDTIKADDATHDLSTFPWLSAPKN